ncbi:MAG TPA: methyltransferase domain-containing protein [Mucilaginibacter sp.]|jgi:ubiquinone/menaquinone biosynthesis C-methylase UbiE|nr:methyltransferase domain-containing protein [Mucilaginibacter sp.]
MDKSAYKFSGEGAINYDRYLGPLLFEPYAIDTAGSIDTANVHAVLELACGTGRVTRHLRRRFKPPVELVATDVSADMLQVAETALNDSSITYRVEDAQNLSFADNTFDVAVCQFGLMFLPDKQQGLREALRVLKPGGRFVFTTWDKTENMPLLKLIFNDIMQPYFKPEDTARLFVPFALHDPHVLEGWMREAGFTNVRSERIVLPSDAPSAEPIVAGLFTKHSLGKEIMDNHPAEFEKVAKRFRDGIGQQFGRADIHFELSAFKVSGRKAG